MRTMTISLFSVLTLFTATCGAHDFSWDNLLMAKMKLDKGFDYGAHVDAYMKVFRPNVWKRYQNDEFELEAKREETIALMKERISAFDLNEEFELNATMTIGKYDFEQNEFPIVEATQSHYWYEYRYSVAEFPSRMSAYFSNPEVVRAIPMEREAAQSFLNRRKDRYGNIDRKVQVNVRFKIEKLKNARDEFLVVIESAKFYDDMGRTRMIHSVNRATAEAMVQR